MNIPFYKKNKFSLILSAAIAASALLPGSAFADDAKVPLTQDDVPEAQMNQVFDLISQYHVSGVDEKQVANTAIKSMIDSLHDPYTVFMTKDDFNNFNNSLEQRVVGVGMRVGQDDKGFYVADVIDGSPAMEGGVKAEDYIVSVDGKPADEMTLDQLVNNITGPEGSSVIVTMKRGDGMPSNLVFKRRAISVPAVESKLFDGGAGYISVTSFSDQADEQFTQQLNELKAKGITSLIIDLRDNPGGILETAQNIAKNFIKEGTLIHTKDRDGADDPVLLSGGSTVSFPVTVLVNGNSASASEVLTGALKDYHAATVIGTQTYGKGSVQEIYKLAGGAALKITVEEYFSPLGHPVNKVGITPDVVVEDGMAQLITAVRSEPGTDKLALSIENHAFTLNDGQFLAHIPVIRKQQAVFVPSRTLAALVGADIEWDGDAQAVKLTKNGQTEMFGLAAGDAVNEEGTCLIDLSRFAEKFPQLTWTDNGDQLDIQVDAVKAAKG